MLLKILLGIAIGATAGALLGSTRSCETGGCPLTANPYRGGVVGGFLGLMVALSFLQAPAGAPRAANSAAPASLITITSDKQWKDAQATLPDKALVVFHAQWCGACKRFAPTVQDVAGKVEGQAKVYYVDVDAAPGAAQPYGIQYLPTTVALVKGKENQTFVGIVDEERLLTALDIRPAAAAAAPAPAAQN
ncbi:MAG TPA: DUF6132 family protein [Candidatus Brocadiia bacterium]|nr:DUF6132 family protein [Candidatus Brocadiia bacterium]